MILLECLLFFFVYGVNGNSEHIPNIDTENYCHVNLKIPKENFRANCDHMNVHHVKESLQTEIDRLNKEVADMKRKQTEETTFASLINFHDAMSRITKLETSFLRLEDRLQSLESASKALSKEEQPVLDLQITDLFSKKKLIRLFKPFLTKEIEEMRKVLKQELLDKLSELGIKTVDSQDSDNEVSKHRTSYGKTSASKLNGLKERPKSHNSRQTKSEKSETSKPVADEPTSPDKFQHIYMALEKLDKKVGNDLDDHWNKTKAEMTKFAVKVEQFLEQQAMKHATKINTTLNYLLDEAVNIRDMENLLDVKKNEIEQTVMAKLLKPSSKIMMGIQNTEAKVNREHTSRHEDQQTYIGELSHNVTLLKQDHFKDINTLNEKIESFNTTLKEFVTNKNLHEVVKSSIHGIVTRSTNSKTKHDEVKTLQREIREDVMNLQHNVTLLNDKVVAIEVQNALQNNKWREYNFKHSVKNTADDCKNGKKYVKQTKFATGQFVGVVLCSPHRYKIYLSDSLTETFLDIADKSGFGKNHCEFVGAQNLPTHRTNRTFIRHTYKGR